MGTAYAFLLFTAVSLIIAGFFYVSCWEGFEMFLERSRRRARKTFEA